MEYEVAEMIMGLDGFCGGGVVTSRVIERGVGEGCNDGGVCN